MTAERPGGAADALRRAFDASFATAPAAAREEPIAFLALRVGAEPFAVRMLETAGLVPARRVVHVPSAEPALLGIAAQRGAILPVYSLARLLGRRGVTEDAPWFLACGDEGKRIALAFTRFEGHLRVEASAVKPARDPGAERSHLAEVLSTAADVRPVIGIRSLLAAIGGA